MSRERERLDEIGKKIKRESGGDHVGCSSSSSSSQSQSQHQNQIINNQQQMGIRRQQQQMVMLSQSQGTLNTITPCAACKLLRRRCAQECPFSPYFSPHEPQKFASVHKVFGASNVSKMLMEVPENQRADAANSLVYEANVRLRDPVYGCMGAISALQQQVQTLQLELNAVRAEILKYKYREANLIQQHHNLPLISPSAVSVVAPPSSQPQQPPPPPPPPSTTTSSMYVQPTNAVDYSSISTDDQNNVAYFG